MCVVMTRRLFAALTALVLVASLTACQRAPAAPEKSAAPEGVSPSPSSSQEAEEEGSSSPLLSVREYDIPSGFECTGFFGDSAMIWDSGDDYSLSSGEGNMLELDLNSGEIRKLGIWADLGRVRADGDTFYWVGMDEEPRYPDRFPEYVQAGIFKGDRDGNGELVYKLSSWEDGQRKWKITQLAMGDSALVWAESWMFKDGGQGPSYHQRIHAMDLKTGKAATVAEWDSYDEIYRQLRMDGDRLIYWESVRNEETSLHLYDLSVGEELLVLPVTSISSADCSGDRLVWCSWSDKFPAFRIYDIASGESTACELSESAYEIKQLGERYLLYTMDRLENGMTMQLFDLDTGEAVHGRVEDSRKDRGKVRLRSESIFDDSRNQAAYTTWFGEDKKALTVVRFLGEA